MTIVINGQDSIIEQARKQLEDIVPVWAVIDLTHGNIVERELLLIKVSAIPLGSLSEEAGSDSKMINVISSFKS
jgi:acetolactate synthase-1/3 small subunit